MDDRRRQNRWLILLSGSVVLLVVARVAAALDCISLFVVLAVAAVPPWWFLVSNRLLTRRLLLEAAARPGSRIRDLLWSGRLLQAMLVPVAMLSASLLVAALQIFEPSQPLILLLLGDALLIAFLAPRIENLLATDIRNRYLAALSRKWPLFISNILLLTLGLIILDGFFIGAPDNRASGLKEVFEQSFLAIQSGAHCAFWGAFSGMVGAIDAAAWYVAELTIPRLEEQGERILFWLLFLARDAGFAGLYSLFLLGLLTGSEQGREQANGASTTLRAFVLTIIVLSLPFLYLSFRLQNLDPRIFARQAGDLAQSLEPPCGDPRRIQAHINSALEGQIGEAREQARSASDALIEQEVERIFARIEGGIDPYLDWIFSVTGEYERLMTVFSGDVITALAKMADRQLLGQVDLERELSSLDARLQRQALQPFNSVLPAMEKRLVSTPCALDLNPRMSPDIHFRDGLRATLAGVSGGSAAVIASKLLAKKTTTALMAKLTAKQSVKTLASMISKAVAKKGASAVLSGGSAALACSPSGPVAVMCGVVAAAVTWLATDKVLIMIDEKLHRDDLRRDMQQALDAQKQQLKEQLRRVQQARIERLAETLHSALKRRFVPGWKGTGQ